MQAEPATVVTSAQLATVFNSSFSDYVGGSYTFTAEEIEEWFYKNFISLSRSRVYFVPGSADPIGFCFIAVRDDKPTESRIPMMGIVPSARGNGTGSRAIAEIIQAEKACGVKTIELECIQENPPAMNLYKRKGFTILRELPGWERDAPPVGEFTNDAELQDCSIDEVDLLVKKHGVEDLPWQAWGFHSRATPTTRGFKLGHAYCAVSDPYSDKEDTVKLLALIVEPGWRLRGEAKRLVKAMLGRFPGKKWESPSIFPGDYSHSIAKELGFRMEGTPEFQMRLDLD